MITDAQQTAFGAILNLSNALQAALIAALVTAAVIVCAIEIVKIPARALFHQLMFRAWVRSAIHRAGLPPDTPELEGEVMDLSQKQVSYFLPSELFLKQVEIVGRNVLETGPGSGSTGDIPRVFAAGAAPVDFELASRADFSGPDDPAIAARARIFDAAERNLDQLQLGITFWWPTLVRWTAALLGISIIGWAASVFLTGNQRIPFVALIVVGILAGYLATIINDSIGILRRWSANRTV